MIPKHRIPRHPGEILLEEFLLPLGLTQVRFARHLRITPQRVSRIVRGERGITPETAWLLAQALGTSPEFWVSLQSAHDLAATRPSRRLAAVRRKAVPAHAGS